MTALDTHTSETQAEDAAAHQLAVADGDELWVRVQQWATQVTC